MAKKASDTSETIKVHPVRYSGASLAWKNWLPIMPDVLADIIKMAMVMDLSER